MPTTTNMLQAYWIDYEVWFRESSAWKYRNWVKRYLVLPPFTNHSDQKPEHNEDNHKNHTNPTHNEVSGFVPSVEDNDENPDKEDNSNNNPTEKPVLPEE